MPAAIFTGKGSDGGTNSATGSGNLLVSRAFDPLLEVHEPWADENGMRVGVDETGKDHISGAVDFGDPIAVFFDPRIA